MKVAVDVDDVTADILADLTKYHNKVYNTHLTLADHKYFDLSKIWNCSREEMIQRVYDFYGSPMMDEIQPMDGAVEGIRALANIADLAFVTSRPVFLHEKTAFWMRKYFPGLELPIYFTDQFSLGSNAKKTKADICKAISAQVMIEDAPAYATDCAEKNILVLLYDRPWNRDIHDTMHITRVFSWKDIYTKVNQIQNNH